MSRHHLAWIAFAGMLGSSTLLSQSAQAQGVWAGSATCTAKTSGPGYSEQQTHRWTINVGKVNSFGAFKQYSYDWTVTGGGTNSVSIWKINGGAKGGFATGGFFQTYVDLSGNLHFEQVPTGGDLRGILVTPRSGGASFPWNIHELELFPAPMIVSAKRAVSLYGTSKSAPTSVAFQAPFGSTTRQVCSWSFRLI
jgi:hypothetical protein